MKALTRQCCAILLATLIPVGLFAAAPVVDDSENFAMLDEQQADINQPVAQDQSDDNSAEEDIALAQNDTNESRSAPDLLNKVQGMRQEIQELRGQLEVQSHQIQQLQQQQLTFYKDLDARLGGHAKTDTPAQLNIDNPAAPRAAINNPTAIPENTVENNALNSAAIPTQRGNPADEQISYMAAYDLVKNKRFDDALMAMQHFVEKYPNGGYTANAQYWLGELFMVKKSYASAIEHFDIVLKQFPGSSKAAACTLKIGYALAASGKEAEARQRLQQVIKNYPDTPTAQLAVAKLRSLSAS